MRAKSVFLKCRCCLASRNEKVELLPLYCDGNSENVQMFEAISGVVLNPSKDGNEKEALICKGCLAFLKRSYNLRTLIQECEKYYFAPRRQTQPTRMLRSNTTSERALF